MYPRCNRFRQMQITSPSLFSAMSPAAIHKSLKFMSLKRSYNRTEYGFSMLVWNYPNVRFGFVKY